MENINFRKVKILFKKGEEQLDTDFFENLLKNYELTLDEKWFLRGCKHITERHYTEAIKRFQLAKIPDSTLMILAVSFKIADKFLFNEYLNELKSENLGEIFKKFKFETFVQIEGEEYKLNLDLIELFKKALN